MYHGVINVYKESGYTSHDVVARLRGICKQKKIGHTGTLDPDAVGVLPVCLGNGTRLFDMLMDQKKEYVAVFRLGIVTDTQDLSGKILEEKPADVFPEEVKKAAMGLVGESMQIPPMYSALKVNGKKLCDLARQGKEIERTPRPVTIHSLAVLKEDHPEYTIKVVCSKGTYIRTLCHDIGQILGCGAAMADLKRTRVGELQIENASTLKELEELAQRGELAKVLIPVERMFASMPPLQVTEEAFKALRNGNQLRGEEVRRLIEEETGKKPADEEEDAGRVAGHVFRDGETFRMFGPQKVFYGVYRYEKTRELLLPVKMFLPE